MCVIFHCAETKNTLVCILAKQHGISLEFQAKPIDIKCITCFKCSVPKNDYENTFLQQCLENNN